MHIGYVLGLCQCVLNMRAPRWWWATGARAHACACLPPQAMLRSLRALCTLVEGSGGSSSTPYTYWHMLSHDKHMHGLPESPGPGHVPGMCPLFIFLFHQQTVLAYFTFYSSEFSVFLFDGALRTQVCLSWAIAGSRVVDNRHHPADVVAGLFLGATFAVVFLLRAIPSLRRADPPKTL